MSARVPAKGGDRRVRVDVSSIIVIFAVFGLIVLLVRSGYDPVVATAAASAAGVTASEIIRRIGLSQVAESRRKKGIGKGNGKD